MSKPIKRTIALKPISREHHHGLLLSWKIREGIRLGIAMERIKNYTDWFWKNHLQSHFEFEENYIFPILDKEHHLIKKVLKEHSRLKQLFAATNMTKQNLSAIEKELVSHIRFEERLLFKEIERVASDDQLEIIEKAHSKNIVDEWEDEFWVTEKKS